MALRPDCALDCLFADLKRPGCLPILYQFARKWGAGRLAYEADALINGPSVDSRLAQHGRPGSSGAVGYVAVILKVNWSAG